MPDPKKEDIWEESTYTVTATIKSGLLGTKYKGKLDLIYKSNDEEIHKDSDIDVSKGQITKDFPVPKVKDGDDTYVLKIIAKYGKSKEKTLVLTEATVWPRTLKLAVKDTEDKPLNEVPFYVDFDSYAQQRGNTGENGIGSIGLRKCGYALGIKAPWEIVSDKNTPKKREHDIVVRRNMEAVFLKPDIAAAAYLPAEKDHEKSEGVRQYVNAPTTAENGCDAQGSVIEFEVACKKRADGQKNDKIYIKVVFSKKSKRNVPVPTLLAPALDITVSPNGKILTGHVVLNSDGGTAKFKLQLGYAGGESFDVTCGYSKGDPSDDKLVFVTWRKVNYQLRFPTQMKVRMTQKTRIDGSSYHDIPDAVKSVVQTRLDAVFVEYENIKSHEFTPAATAPCIVTKGFFENLDAEDATPMYVIDENLVWLGGAPAFDPVADKREITITFCDAALDEGTKVLNPTIEVTAPESTHIIDPSASYKYFVKRPFVADEVNLTLTGYRWSANIAKVLDADKHHKPALAVTFEQADFDDWNDFKVSEADAGAGIATINFGPDSDALSALEKASLKTYYETCFIKEPQIRKNKNKLNFIVRGAASDAGDASRKNAIIAELQSIHAASTKKVLFHPGIKDDGSAWSGEMSEIEISQVTARKLKVKLPTRVNETEALRPGDFVGPASASKCPVNVAFSILGAYTYNGHAGGGDQVLVLRNAIPEAIAATVCHELGHSMGVSIMPTTGASAMPVPPGLAVPLHVDNGGTYYRNKSASPYNNGYRKRHQGPHCCDGMPGANKPSQNFNGWGTSGAAKVCIMWGEGGASDDRSQYCPSCTEYLVARDLRDVRKQWAGSAEG